MKVGRNVQRVLSVVAFPLSAVKILTAQRGFAIHNKYPASSSRITRQGLNYQTDDTAAGSGEALCDAYRAARAENYYPDWQFGCNVPKNAAENYCAERSRSSGDKVVAKGCERIVLEAGAIRCACIAPR